MYDLEREGGDVVMLDAAIAGCVSTALTRGHLDEERAATLEHLRPVALSAARGMPPGPSRDHLLRLTELAQMVLATYSREPPA